MKTIRKIAIPFSTIMLIYLLFPSVIEASRSHGLTLQLHLFALSLFIAIIFTPITEVIAKKIGAMDIPDHRKTHKKPTPLFGGLAVFVAFFAAHLIQLKFDREMIGVFLGGSLILIVGLIDDKTGGIPAWFRLIVQLAASAIVICSGVVLDFYPYTLWGKTISIIISIIWLVGITNALNFLDGMDGLASGLSAVASGIFFIVAYRLNSPYLGYLAITLCGASLGFLLFNFKPADIFLGDAGATFLGFTLACFGIMGDWSQGNPFVSFSVPVLILSIPIFDMIHTTIERIMTGKVKNLRDWIVFTGRDHFHHRLSDHGFKDTEVVLFVYFINLTIGFTAVVISGCSIQNMSLLLSQAFCLFIIITILMSFAAKKNEQK